MWIDENRVGHEAFVGSCIAAFEQIRSDDAKVVVGNMRELRPAFDIAQRVHSRDVRLEFVIDLDISLLVRFNSSRREIQIFSIGFPAHSTQQMCSG